MKKFCISVCVEARILSVTYKPWPGIKYCLTLQHYKDTVKRVFFILTVPEDFGSTVAAVGQPDEVAGGHHPGPAVSACAFPFQLVLSP